MKNVILSAAILSEMPTALVEQILSYQKESTTCSDLKKRIKALDNNYIDHRTDTDVIDLGTKEDAILRIDRWEKTDGEQWGNCYGRNYNLKVGRKFAKVEIDFYRTNSPGSFSNVPIPLKEVERLVSLLEMAEQSDNEVDSEKYYRLASQEMSNAVEPEYAY